MDNQPDNLVESSLTFATLVVHGNHLHPDQITDALQLNPSQTRVKGEGGAKLNLWTLTTQEEVQSHDALAHLTHLLVELNDRDDDVQDLQSQGCEFTITITWQPASPRGGPRIDSETLARLAELQISLWFDILPATRP